MKGDGIRMLAQQAAVERMRVPLSTTGFDLEQDVLSVLEGASADQFPSQLRGMSAKEIVSFAERYMAYLIRARKKSRETVAKMRAAADLFRSMGIDFDAMVEKADKQ